MDLLVVGSGAAYPNVPGTASSCYVVRHAGAAICLDLGQGSFAGLAGRLEPADLLAIFVSHLHADHFVDLVALRHYLRYEFDPPRRVRVVAPAGLADRLDGLTGEPGFGSATLDIETRTEGVREVGPFVVESRRVTHTNDSHATRVGLRADPEAPGLVYSGDCGRANELAPLIRPGDTLLSEVGWGPGPIPAPDMHLDAAAIAGLVSATRPARVRLTHLQPNRDQATTLARVKAAFEGDVTLVRDGDIIPI